MKKIITALLTLVSLASADIILGTDVSYSKAKGEVEASYMGASASDDYTDKMTAVTLKGGYGWERARVLGYYSFENYRESDKSKSYGLEIDYIVPNEGKTDLLLGLMIAKGELDADGLAADFKDVGAKVGIITELNESLGLEAGLQYKFRNFDDMEINGVTLEGDEKLIGIYLGLNFSL